MVDSKSWEKADQAALRIHASANELQLRTRFLEDCQALVPSRISFFDLVGNGPHGQVFFSPLSLTMDKERLADYYRSFIDVDYTSWVQHQPDSRPVYRDSDFISDDARRRSSLYREWLEPMGVVYGCSVIVSDERNDYGTLTLGRGADEGDFTDDELELLRVLERHMALRFSQLAPNGFSAAMPEPPDGDPWAKFHLTPRETEVARLLCQSVPNAQIATALCISPHTLSRHTANIYRKLGVSSRIELMETLRGMTP